ncbi:MAG TPA: VWA domain-containing protein [Candidatus Acidoferrales bacterium]|nr:VWA domain-containing protein [Candidatus Acidoferrales bacterium]
MKLKFILILSAATLFSAGLYAQQTSGTTTQQSTAKNPSPQQQAPSRLIVPSHIVNVPVTVKDTRGDLVPDLEKRDFRIFQDGVEQQVQFFSSDPIPISAVILLDDNLPNRPAEQVQRSLDSIAAGFGPRDEVSVVRFDEYPKTVLDFTTSNDALFAELKKIRTDPKDALDSRTPGTASQTMTSGPTVNGQPIVEQQRIPILGTETNGVTKHLDDALHYAAEVLRNRDKNRRRIIFVVSDGTNDRHNQWSFDNTLHVLLETEVSVYAIAVGPEILKFESGRLSKYATATGGDVFYSSKQSGLEKMYSLLTEEARNRYTLAFQPTTTPGRGNYHVLEVRVERPNLTVTAREGYYASFPR